MLKQREVAEMLGVTNETLLRWRNEGIAPPHIKLPSGLVRFRIEDVEKWLKKSEGK
ncbi:helix-turn-helix transcriptional regulator [Corynebacterium casei]|uniref:helix-turn-helix transcriptional regulator n=1 Tax=Corynebacterium casei TaxID=160386 RepID=UPI003FD21C67